MRNELITKINDLFDENTNLKVRNAFLEAKEEDSEKVVNCERQEKTKLDIKIINYGKKVLAKEVLSSWGNEVRIYRDDDTKQLIITDFEKWFKERVIDSNVPTNLSKEELKELIYPYAKEQYEKEKAESIKKFEERELKETESNE